MCNRFVQKGRMVKPGERARVLMKGPGAVFELPFDDAIFGGPARRESRNYWIRREGAELVRVPEIERFGEKDQRTGAQNWEDLPAGSALEGLLLPQPPGKDYRLLKIVTQAASFEQSARLGNDRVPILFPRDELPGFSVRLAREDDIEALEILIPISVRALQASSYSSAQMEAALGPVFGVDRQLMADGTYFVVEQSAGIVGCGGWSRRSAVFGGDRGRTATDVLLDPARDPARIRAFFVHPEWARRGVGRAILQACEAALWAAGFREAMLVATLAGEPFYASFGYSAVERYEVPLSDALVLPVVRMVKSFDESRRPQPGTFQAQL